MSQKQSPARTALAAVATAIGVTIGLTPSDLQAQAAPAAETKDLPAKAAVQGKHVGKAAVQSKHEGKSAVQKKDDGKTAVQGKDVGTTAVQGKHSGKVDPASATQMKHPAEPGAAAKP